MVRYFPPQSFKGHVEHNTNFSPQKFELAGGGIAPTQLVALVQTDLTLTALAQTGSSFTVLVQTEVV